MEKRHTFAVLSFARQNRNNTHGEISVYLRITVDGKRSEISTKTIVPRDKWIPGKGRLKGNSEEVRHLNQGIITFEHRAREIYNRFIEQGKVVTVESIKNELLGNDHKQRMLLEQFRLVLQNMKLRINTGFSAGTVKNWSVTERHLQEFLIKHYLVSDIAFKQLELKFITDFEWFARTHWSCGNNAALKHIERIRKVVKKAVANDWLVKDPFMSFEGKQAKSHRTFLTKHELESIQNKTFEIERLEKVKDVFVFCCYTGLAHIDVEKLTPDNIVMGIDGKKWIYTFREKNDNKSNIPLLPAAINIIEKYRNHHSCLASNRLLPVITNIKTNAYLKEIADVCEIKKNLTFHMARHTFATTITLTNGVPIETVSNMLGHSKITTTQIYAKVLENKVSEDMERLEKKLLFVK
ncbi:MAG: site-specific integrase [Chitinophagaceae bacterium]